MITHASHTRSVWILLTTTFALLLLDRLSIGHFETQLKQQYLLSDASYHWLSTGLFGIAYASSQLPACWCLQTIGLKRTALIGFSLIITGCLACLSAQSYLLLLFSRALLALGSSAIFLTLQLSIRMHASNHALGYYNGISHAACTLGALASGIPLAQCLPTTTTFSSWHAMLLPCYLLGFLYLVFAYSDAPTMDSIANQPSSRLSFLTNNLRYFLHLACFAGLIYFFAEYGSENILRYFLHLKTSNHASAELLISELWLGYACGSVAWGKLMDIGKGKISTAWLDVSILSISISWLALLWAQVILHHLVFFTLGASCAADVFSFALIMKTFSHQQQSYLLAALNSIIGVVISVCSFSIGHCLSWINPLTLYDYQCFFSVIITVWCLIILCIKHTAPSVSTTHPKTFAH